MVQGPALFAAAGALGWRRCGFSRSRRSSAGQSTRWHPPGSTPGYSCSGAFAKEGPGRMMRRPCCCSRENRGPDISRDRPLPLASPPDTWRLPSLCPRRLYWWALYGDCLFSGLSARGRPPAPRWRTAPSWKIYPVTGRTPGERLPPSTSGVVEISGLHRNDGG